MRQKRLKRSFFIRPTLQVSKDLLGKYLVRKIGKRKVAGKIVEVEAYIGPKDKASHAYNGRITPRNKTEYLEGGRVYIYLCYGLHWQFNITTATEGKPECVLIRALEPVGIKERAASGPGKLCRWMELDKSFDGENLCQSDRVRLEDRGEKAKHSQITAAVRVGIDYAGEWAKKRWRFYLKDNPFVSRK